ncbi:MAG: cupin domain-containing protein [Bacteroidota bacterium]
MTEIDQIINALELKPHPEGGFYKETYRSDGVIKKESLGTDFEGSRNYSTCIYFLLTSEHFSAFHKIHQDEIWHFYKGSSMVLHIISKAGEYKTVNIGNDFAKGEVPQYVVNAGDYFAAEVPHENAYVLVGCTVSPGFDFRDFIMPTRSELKVLYPKHKDVIQRLSRD